MSSVWPKTKMRLEQIGLEIALDNQQTSDMLPKSQDVPSSPSQSIATTTTEQAQQVSSGAQLNQSMSLSLASSLSTVSSTGLMSLSSPSSIATPPTQLNFEPNMDSITNNLSEVITNHINNNHNKPEEQSHLNMSTRISSEFERNQFFVSNHQSCPNQEPIVTDLPPEDIFEELDHLGMGSSGNVYKMRHKPTGKICAVKQMRRTINEEENKRIYMDLKSLLDCKCDNIVQCCGYFIKQSEVWLCMELMTTCFDKLLNSRQRRPLPERFVGGVAASAVKALNYLKEEQNIIHRDVKPSNILINDEGLVKLCDFGISGRLENSLAKTRAGCLLYMAPERIQPSQEAYDVRADVWSLGITLFELAIGKSPYADVKDTFSILTRIVRDEPPRLPEDMGFSEEFKDFIAACLTHNYKLRPKFKDLIEHSFIKHHWKTIVKLSELD